MSVEFAASSGDDSLRRRVATASVAVPVALVAIFALPTEGIAVAFAIVAVGASLEWTRIETPSRIAGCVFALIVAGSLLILWVVGSQWRGWLWILCAVSLAWWCVALVWIVRFEQGQDAKAFDGALTRGIVGWLIIVPAWAALVYLHSAGEDGPWRALFVLIIVWVADISAYFAGRRFGNRRLAVVTSPGKSVEGAPRESWRLPCWGWRPVCGSAWKRAMRSVHHSVRRRRCAVGAGRSHGKSCKAEKRCEEQQQPLAGTRRYPRSNRQPCRGGSRVRSRPRNPRDAAMKRLVVCGSTGSIGLSTLDVVSRNKTRFEIFALTAHSNVGEMTLQCRVWRPRFAVMADESAATVLSEVLSPDVPETTVLAGAAEIVRVATHPDVDYVMAAIVGGAGLMPSLAAARAGKRVLLANKEALVMSGRLFMDAVREGGADLLPIDSEHNAIFQCMSTEISRSSNRGVHRILLTGSGGPFRARALGSLQDVTPDEACAHPNWSMGRKISVDSATMMNKGLEVIEACWLFDTVPEAVEVVVHPQSVIHSMVEFADGSVLAHLANPDMRTPIAHALAWPERIASGVSPLDLIGVSRLEFEAPDFERFPCLRIGSRLPGPAARPPRRSTPRMRLQWTHF